MLKGAIFDLDGVLVDTVPLHFRAWKKMFAEYNKEFTFEDYKRKVDGIPRESGARAVLSGLSEKELAAAADRKQKYFLEFLNTGGVAVHADAVKLVEGLKENNIGVAVISSSLNCRYILKKAGIEKLFKVVISGNDVERGKPFPDVFLLAGRKLGLRPQECVVFEDARLGVEAAVKGGFKCVGIDRYHDPQRLAPADLVVSDLSEASLARLQGLFL